MSAPGPAPDAVLAALGALGDALFDLAQQPQATPAGKAAIAALQLRLGPVLDRAQAAGDALLVAADRFAALDQATRALDVVDPGAADALIAALANATRALDALGV